MTQPYIALDTKLTKTRILLAVAAIGTIIVCWFGVRWQLGNMLGELTRPNDPRAGEIASTAIGLAPGDPMALWLAASTGKQDYSEDGLRRSVQMYEETVRRSPYDYRWWIELGRAYEQTEQFDAAEGSLRRAVELGPSYTYPRWQLGNYLLRRGRVDEAFAELKKTTENNLTYRDQVFSLAWDYFGKDPAKLEQNISDAPDVRASLALFYAARERAEDSLRIWNTLTPEQKEKHPQTARTIAQGLTEKHYFREALEFSRQLGIDPDSSIEAVTNPGFEKPVGDPDDNFFGWNLVRGDNKLDISVDSSVKHSGARSLKLNFRTYVKPGLYNAWQIVAVQPNQSYTLKFWLRTDSLRSAGVPVVDVLNGNDNLLLATSPPFPTGSVDWQEVTIDFKAPENCEGIIIRTSRTFCGEACPIVGTVWYDDFSLTKR
jgi:tetratricopeptide (TPR) repeat protein